MTEANERWAWVLGDQLSLRDGPAARYDKVLLIESNRFAARKQYHPQKLTVVFSAMRHFRDRLREDGMTVHYEVSPDFETGLARFFEANPDVTLEVMAPTSHRARVGLKRAVDTAGGDIEVVGNQMFLCSTAAFEAWLGDQVGTSQPDPGAIPKHETFYRWMRRRTGYLMEGDKPAGGQWNYDEQNRETPPAEYEPPSPPTFEVDALTRRVHERVCQEFDGWGSESLDPLYWPVTRTQARRALRRFVEERLPDFGAYQDAMVEDAWALNHALLSPALNLGLLGPAEVIEAVIEAGARDEVPLNAVEGVVRQLLGWREYVRQVYRLTMPEMAAANQLGADRELPPAYWVPDSTEMACLSDSVEGVYERGYAHHIQRLMVLSNFALLYGVDPAALNEWFHVGFVDAYHWVTTPNVIGMGVFGTDTLATKPYAASANYIDRMSDYCDGCAFDPDATTGEGACPFNALYWDFLARHEEELRDNYRMGLVYSHLDDKRGSELDAIRARAAALKEGIADGEI
ncbi:MAG: cryptochrome/photolyase family protein [Halodesulfurarchaeum sp.]